MSAEILTAKHAKTANKKGSVPCCSRKLKNGVSSQPLGENNGRAFKGLGLDLIKRSVRCNPNRERRENRESLYDLFLFVCTLRVVRGSWNSKGVSVVIFTVKWAKTANKKGSASGSLSSTLRKVCRKGSALNPGQQECFLSLPSYHRWLRKTCESLYWFAFPCSRRSRCSRFMILNRSVH